MTKNQTGLGLFCAVGIELLVVCLLILTAGLTASQFMWATRENLRRADLRQGRRAQRRDLAA
jgi:hypothetical protein